MTPDPVLASARQAGLLLLLELSNEALRLAATPRPASNDNAPAGISREMHEQMIAQERWT